LWSLASAGFENILCLSGDYPAKGIGGQARPVFDVDSAGLLEMVRRISTGAYGAPDRPGPEFFAGAAVNPYKQREGEYVPQLQKMRLKARTGAHWFVTQIGYDARKQDELARYALANGVQAPFLGTVFPLGVQSARAFHKWAIPGVCVPDTLLAIAEKQAASQDKGRKFFIELAAKQVAIFRGLGYRGVHLSGRPDFERVREVLELERAFGPDDWKQFAREVQHPQPGEFYLYEQDGKTGLSSGELNRKYAAGLGRRRNALRRLAVSPAFQLGRAAHAVALSDGAPAAGAGRVAYRLIEKSRAMTALAHTFERAVKLPMYGCRDCGDCSLPESAYLCPESQCAKNQRNGPCGGTKAGRCEVLDKDCVWLRAYDRLKLFGEEGRMLDGAPVLCDASLRGTSSWANAVLGRDHAASASGASSDAASH
jgi:methylenetetrahydrofolate reductase (NADPH)